MIQVRDVLARLPGMGDVRVFGSGDYAMRLWLDPGKIAAREHDGRRSAQRRARAERRRSPPAGSAASRRCPAPQFGYIVNAQGRLQTRGRVRQHHHQDRRRRRRRLPARRGAHRARPGDVQPAQHARRSAGRRHSGLPAAGRQRAHALERSARHDGGAVDAAFRKG